MSLDDLIKFRSTALLKIRLERIAAKLRRDMPDMLRIALEDYAAEEERRLNLPAIEETITPQTPPMTLAEQHVVDIVTGKDKKKPRKHSPRKTPQKAS